ncbi:MAG: alkaline phosphatase family protein [Clostridia bacterium]|nr:alkaline phosphatase family protein [Clostridia bacterium]
MGNFCKNADAPFLKSMAKNGASTCYAYSMMPTISAENWGAMLLGSTPIVHGLTNSIVGRYEYKNKALPSVFTRIRKAMPDAFLASHSNWNPINHGIIEHDIDVHFGTEKTDAALLPGILETVKKKPVFLFVQFDDVDGAGHHFGYGTEDYLKQVSLNDSYTKAIYEEYVKAGIADDTLFIVIADHGGVRNGHGGYEETEKYVYFAAIGDGLKKSEIKYAETRDIAATVLYALGLDVPEYDEKGFTSQVPQGIFPWYDGSYFKAEKKEYVPYSKPTPDLKGENGLCRFFPEEKMKLVMFMDNCMKDETGKCTLTEHGIVKYYSEGVRGSRGEFGNTGYVTVDGADFSGSFTVAVWFKIDPSLTDAPAVFGNKDWWYRNRRGLGFMLALRCADTVFNIGCGDDDFDFNVPFPEDVKGGWVHTTVSVDFENRELRVYYNFKLRHKREIEPQFIIPLNSSLPLTVGNDGVHTYNNEIHQFIFNMDDLFVFDGAFDGDDVEKLEEYYKG